MKTIKTILLFFIILGVSIIVLRGADIKTQEKVFEFILPAFHEWVATELEARGDDIERLMAENERLTNGYEAVKEVLKATNKEMHELRLVCYQFQEKQRRTEEMYQSISTRLAALEEEERNSIGTATATAIRGVLKKARDQVAEAYQHVKEVFSE